jgi:lysophospholipase L1-like esterase
MKKTQWLVTMFTISLAAASIPAQAAHWQGSWGAAPLPPSVGLGPFPATPSFNNQTIRQVVRLSAGGSRVRVRFTNEYGAKPLVIGKASIALTDTSGAVKAGTEHALTFAGKRGVTIPTAAPLLSDPVDLPVQALSSLSISLYFPEDTGACTCHQTGMQTAYVSEAGDFTGNATFTPKQKIQMRAFISGVEVEGSGKTVVVLGDSISDGVGSTVDANRRWPDQFADRLLSRGWQHSWGVVNMGISGNRVLADGLGQGVLARFDRDVLSVPEAAYVIVFEGINDLGLSHVNMTGPAAERFKNLASGPEVTTESLMAGYRQLIERAHERGLKIIGATITPYQGAMYYSAEGETIREAVNTWIRTGHAFDGVIDFDAVIRDPAHPAQMKDGFHMGDHLHGSDAGYEAMAKAINLSLFK